MDSESSRLKGLKFNKNGQEILKGTCYINDEIIESYFRFLAHIYEDEDILLVPPAVSYLLANCTDYEVLRHTAESLKLHDKKLVFFTINNQDTSTNLLQGQGSSTLHWSLLVYYRTSNVFVYHDSVEGFNYCHARKLYNTVKDFVGDSHKRTPLGLMAYLRPKKVLNKKGKRVRGNLPKPSRCDDVEEEASFVESYTPQQTNAYDCGLYVMKTAAVICEWYLCKNGNEDDYLWYDEVKKHVIGSYVENYMRSELLELTESAQGECF